MDQLPRCQQCNVRLKGQDVGGLCANCLLKLALDPLAEATVLTDEAVDGSATANAAPREVVGSRIGRYKLLQEIGEGGFGIVYLADQLEPVKRRVALKVLKPGMDTRDVVARFEAERQALALMDHPNIARIFDGGATESGRPYFVMELVKGIPLTKYCDDQQLTTRQRLDLFLDVLAAVQHAHQKGIIHRDLKPSNILVSPHDGRPVIKVIDFGIAKAISLELTEKTLFTAHGRMIGTPQYMSPEQAEINALDVDTRSDIYALGVLLYELLTGRTPLDAKKLRKAAYAEIQRLIREVEPPKPSTLLKQLQSVPGAGDSCAKSEILSRAERDRLANSQPNGRAGKRVNPQSRISTDLDWIVMKCLEKDRARRYETANGFAADLRRHLENQPVVARPPGAGYLLSRFVRRHKFGFVAGAAVALSLFVGIAATTWGLFREAAARKSAESGTIKAMTANAANKQNLHLASMADYASAVKALDEDSEAVRKGERAIGFAGKSRWHEGVALLTRSLEREPENAAAALRLYETLRSRQAEKRDWSLHKFKYDERVWSASFSQDGTRIVTGSEDKGARVWDVATGQAIGEPMRHEWIRGGSPKFLPGSAGHVVLSASFSPDGTRIVTASDDNTARVWDAATRQTIGEPMRHEGGVLSANFSTDGLRIVTASVDKTARVWDATTGQAIGEPMRHETPVYSACFSPDGTHIVTASDDKGARVWDAATHQAIGEPLRHDGGGGPAGVKWANFSPDGTRIVTASDDNTARVWDATTGKAIGEPMRHETPVHSACFSPDGLRIVTASTHRARVWDAATRQAIGEPMRHEEWVASANFSPDGIRIVTASFDQTARVWDATSGQVIGEPMRHKDNYVRSANFSPDGTRIVTASVSPNGAQVVTASFSRDGNRIVTANGEGPRVWDATTGNVVLDPMRQEEGVSRTNLSVGNTRGATEQEKTARVWDATTGQAIGEPMRHQGWVNSANFSHDGIRIVTASDDQTARVWDAATGRAIGEPMHPGGWVKSANFSPDGSRIVTASTYQPARVWWILTKDESEAIPSITPEILAWARNFSGLRFSENGELHPIPDDERMAPIANPVLPAGPWADLAKWIATPVPHRTTDPKSKLTFRQIAERERDFQSEGDVESLESALRYDTTLPLARLFLAAALERADAALDAKYREASLQQRAAFLRRYDLVALAREKGKMKDEELAALWVRAANHLFELPPETKIGVGPKVTIAREEAEKAARKALELVPGLPAAEEVLRKF